MKAKLKNRKSALKRVKPKKNCLCRKKAYRGHLLRKKTKKQLRRLSEASQISSSDSKAFQLMIPYS